MTDKISDNPFSTTDDQGITEYNAQQYYADSFSSPAPSSAEHEALVEATTPNTLELDKILEKVLQTWKQDYPKSDGHNGLLMDEYFDRLKKAKDQAQILSLLSDREVEIKNQTELNTLTNLRNDYIGYTLSTPAEEWRPIVNFIDDKIAQLATQKGKQ